MKRVIGYVKPELRKGEKPHPLTSHISKEKVTVESHPSFVKTAPKKEKILGRSDKSKIIADWIINHPEFKWSAMCLKLGIDKANFQRSFKAEPPNIKDEYIPKIEAFLKNYGYGS